MASDATGHLYPVRAVKTSDAIHTRSNYTQLTGLSEKLAAEMKLWAVSFDVLARTPARHLLVSS